jgi:hypothetical protein
LMPLPKPEPGQSVLDVVAPWVIFLQIFSAKSAMHS